MTRYWWLPAIQGLKESCASLAIRRSRWRWRVSEDGWRIELSVAEVLKRSGVRRSERISGRTITYRRAFRLDRNRRFDWRDRRGGEAGAEKPARGGKQPGRCRALKRRPQTWHSGRL